MQKLGAIGFYRTWCVWLKQFCKCPISANNIYNSQKYVLFCFLHCNGRSTNTSSISESGSIFNFLNTKFRDAKFYFGDSVKCYVIADWKNGTVQVFNAFNQHNYSVLLIASCAF